MVTRSLIYNNNFVIHKFKTSVTRFGDISPQGQNLNSHFFWQNVAPTLANFLCFWENFRCCKWTNNLFRLEYTIYTQELSEEDENQDWKHKY